jgi:hypothetical protein
MLGSSPGMMELRKKLHVSVFAMRTGGPHHFNCNGEKHHDKPY